MGPPIRLLLYVLMKATASWRRLVFYMMEELEEEFSHVAELIKKASILLIMSGAGMSAESGLRTYEEINRIYMKLYLIHIEDSHNTLEYRDYCDPDLVGSCSNLSF